MKNWIKSEIEQDDIIISSRVRLARNIKEIPFPHRLNPLKSKDIIDNIENNFKKDDYNFNTIKLWENNDFDNRIYLEKHLISNKLLANKDRAAFITNSDETISIMINEEDHIRIQAISSGFNLKEVYNQASLVDDKLEEKLPYAFSEKLGYLTSCPTNCGTGLRASVMIHLPALSMEKEMNKILNYLAQLGITIRGLYGEGSKIQGDLYQISNQITLGLSEEEIINNLTAIVEQIKKSEFTAREKLYTNYKYELQDKIFRSFGILKSSIIMSFTEMSELLSNVRMGIELGLINNIPHSIINELLLNCSPSYISKTFNETDEKFINIKRAEIIKEKLKSL
ncbi:protein arginine kinase [Hathewaya histolytica]|uniref:protein arginine kinase n=1 Tax=Hathewaya histolytica TaxID=1498 RepID=UPI003B680B3A